MGTSVYPGALDNFAEASPPYLADDDTTGRDHPARHDDMEAAMAAVQGELGTDPSGGSATVKARLDAADSTVASKAPLDSPAFTGTVNFTGTSIIGLPAAGKILQIVRATDSTDRITSSSTYVDVTGMTVTITPTKSDSAILVICIVNGATNSSTDNLQGNFAVTDSSDNVLSEVLIGTNGLTGSGTRTVRAITTVFGYSTPATTASVTYKLRFMVAGASDVRSLNSAVSAGQIYALEISA